MNDTKLFLGIGIATLVIVVGGIIFTTRPQSNTPKAPISVSSDILIKEDSHVSTSSATPVTMVEFGDFQCPSCAVAFPAIKETLAAYKDQIRLVFRQFPLYPTPHKNADIAAEASEAAADQGKFFEMCEVLYQKQSEWGESNNPMDFFMKYAEDLKLDKNQFKDFVDNKKGQDRINKDKDDGIMAGVQGTPTIFINGILFEGNFADPAAFKAVIDPILTTSK